MEAAFQNQELPKLGVRHSQAFVDCELLLSAYDFEEQQIDEVQQSDSQQYQADDQGGKNRVQAGDGEVFLVFASAGDADAPVQPLLIFIQISFKCFLFIFVDPDGSLAYALVGKQSVEGSRIFILKGLVT